MTALRNELRKSYVNIKLQCRRSTAALCDKEEFLQQSEAKRTNTNHFLFTSRYPNLKSIKSTYKTRRIRSEFSTTFSLRTSKTISDPDKKSHNYYHRHRFQFAPSISPILDTESAYYRTQTFYVCTKLMRSPARLQFSDYKDTVS